MISRIRTGFWFGAAILLGMGSAAPLYGVQSQEPLTSSSAQRDEGAEPGPEPIRSTRAQRPHEPQEFEPFAEFDGSVIPRFPRARAGAMGSWYAFPRGNRNLTIAEDPDAPISPREVIRTRFPTGQKGGLGSVNWGGWDEGWSGPAGQKRAVYISLWLKVEGRDFENQATGTKAGFIAFGREGKGSNEATFFLDNGGARQRVQDRFMVQFKEQGIPQPNGRIGRNLNQNRNRTPLMTVGKWHQWEAVLQLNDLERTNGIFRMWIDGTLVLDYSDLVYVTPMYRLGFNLFKWNPTWGGSGGHRTRDDYIDVDHVYLSGLPLQRKDPE